MNKICIATAFLLCGGSLFLSCEKQESKVPAMPPVGNGLNAPAQASGPEIAATTIPDKTICCTYQSTGWCYGSPKNCQILEDIVINGIFADLSSAISLGNPGAIGDFFADPAHGVLTEQLNNSYRQKLLSRDYYLSVSGRTSSRVNLIAGTVYPVTPANMEFSFEFNYE